MGSFLTPQEMFQEYMDQSCETDRQYQNLMYQYADEAADKIGEYFECISEAYLEGCKKAAEVFKSKGLKNLHAYAVNDHLIDFIQEFDETERFQKYDF